MYFGLQSSDLWILRQRMSILWPYTENSYRRMYMGCWGITALESDDGLDAVGCIRYNLPKNGQLDLGEMLERLKKDQWNAPVM